MFQYFSDFLTFIGLYVLIFYLYDNLKTPFMLLLSELKQFIGIETKLNVVDQYGSWVAITGCTDGIGKAYAQELARRGLNIVLISRNLQKLQNVASEIESDFSVETKIIVADFSDAEKACRQVEKALDNISVRILINNVGQNTAEPGKIMNFTDDEIWSVIKTNIGPVTQLSRYFIKRLHDANQAGLILNVSSGTELIPVPYGAVYAATKAYIRSLTWALREEARPYGIEVELLSPNFVSTKMNVFSDDVMRGNIFIPNAEMYARSAVNRLGKVDETTGYSWHDFQIVVWKMFPRRLQIYLAKNIIEVIISRSKIRKSLSEN